MKRILYVSLCIAGVVVFGFFFLQKSGITGLNPAGFLPEDVLVVIEQKNLYKKIQKFKESRLGKVLREIDYVQIAVDIGLPEEEVAFIRDLQDNTGNFIESPIFSELFGEEVICAFLQPKTNVLDELERNLENSLVLIARPKHDAKVLEMIATFFAHDIRQTDIQYGKHIIHRYELDEGKVVAATRIGGLVVMALDERNIRSSLDRYDEKGRSLLNNEDYNELKNSLESPDLFAYSSLALLKKKIEELIVDENLPEKEELLHELETWNGWRAGAYGAWQKPNKVTEKAVILFDKEKLHPYVREMVSIVPEKNTEISMVAKDTLAYYWTNTFNLQYLFKMYVTELGNDRSQIDALEKSVEQATGVALQKVIASIGHKIGFIVQKMNSEEFIPLPDFSIFLGLNDSKLTKDALEKMLLHWEIPFQSQKYRDVELFFWGMVPQAGMQPVVAFYDEHLFIASSVAMIKKIVDTAKDGNGLITNEDFKKVEHGLLEENNSTAYIQIGAIVEIVKELVSWGGTMIAIQDRQVAHTSKILIDKLIHPFLDGLKMYSVMGARSYIQGEQIVNSAETFIDE